MRFFRKFTKNTMLIKAQILLILLSVKNVNEGGACIFPPNKSKIFHQKNIMQQIQQFPKPKNIDIEK